MHALVFGAGNLLYADEGIGVHLVKYLEERYREKEGELEFFDAGTLGVMAAHKFEEAEIVIVVDALETAGEPGEIRVYDGADIRADAIPVKLSPHQIGLQEMMMICELREKSPRVVKLVGVIPQRMEVGEMELSPLVQERLPLVAQTVIELLVEQGVVLQAKV
jgi:hydrogenase maturation protease